MPRIRRAPGCIGAQLTGQSVRRPRSGEAPMQDPIGALGTERAVVADVLGDLAEERAMRSTRDGPISAAYWYCRELSRSAPHLAVDAIQRALHTPRGRTLILTATGVTTTALVMLGVAVSTRDVPAQLSVGTADTVVVNNERTTRIPVHLLDAAGRTLDDDARGARFRTISADDHIAVSPGGDVSCHRSGFARVQVERGALSRTVVVQCAPVREFSVDVEWQLLAAGGPPEPIRIRGVAPDSSPVTRMVGSVTVRDSDIVAIHGSELVPKRVGSTVVQVTVGDHTALLPETVHRAAASPSTMQIDDVFSTDLSLEPASEAHWPMHQGLYTIWLRPFATQTRSPLHLMLQNFNCAPSGPDQRYFCVALPGAELTVVAPSTNGASTPLGSRLIVARHRNSPEE